MTQPRAVEVHHVQDTRRLRLPPACRVDGIRVMGDLPLVVALGQPNHVALANVDRRIEDHAGTAAQIRAKLASRRRPAALDFSGWNWTPYRGGRAIAQAKRSPHSALPSASVGSTGRTPNECTK